MWYILFPFFALALFYIFWNFNNKEKWQSPNSIFPPPWKDILIRNVSFYNSLTNEEKKHFEFKIQEFLLNCRITGISTQIDDTDRILLASSAIIPIFNFKDWKYINIAEVLIYPDTFDQNFQTEGQGRRILGMVGTGYMNNKMIISKNALREGFSNETDKKNTAIHEFVHLIDKMDGYIDGIPEALMKRQYSIPWIDLMKKKIDEINKTKSDINSYGATNKAEFFAVASEYFFERPKLLKQKHPKLYNSLEMIFQQNMDQKKLFKKRSRIGRNDPCPCESGKKFKKCCGGVHYS